MRDFYNHVVGPRVPTARSALIDASRAARNRLPATIVQTMSASPSKYHRGEDILVQALVTQAAVELGIFRS